MKKLIPIIITSLFVFLKFGVSAQSPLWAHLLNADDGLSILNVSDIYLDSYGFIWIGSFEGLNRYDGHTVHRYTSDLYDTTKVKENYITGNFYEDSRHDLWFCTNTGIQVYRRDSDLFNRYEIKDQRGLPIKDGYQALYLERDSFLWLKAANNQLYYYNIHDHIASTVLGETEMDIAIFPGNRLDGSLKYLFSVNGTNGPGIEVFTFGTDKKLHHRGVHFNGKTPKSTTFRIHAVHYEKETSVWLATDQGIVHWNMITNQHRKYTIGTGQRQEIVANKDGDFWLVKRNQGLFFFNRLAGTFTKKEVRIIDDIKLDLNRDLKRPFVDHSGNLWITLNQEGLVFCDPDKAKFKTIPKPTIPQQNGNYKFRTLAQRKDGQIWCSTYNNGLLLLSPRGDILQSFGTNYPPNNTLFDDQINHILLDDEENLWIGTPTGVSFYSPGTQKFQEVLDSEGQAIPYPVYFYQLQDNRILISTLQKGLYVLLQNDGKWQLQQIRTPEDENDYLTTIYEDSNNSIYVSHRFTEILVFTYYNGNLKPLTSLPIQGVVNGFYESPKDETIWIATSEGLVTIDKTNLEARPKLYSEKEGLKHKYLQSIIADNENYLWFSTTKGITRLDQEGQFTSFSLADGMQSILFDELAGLKHSDGSLWFGGAHGLTIVEPHDIKFLKKVPKIQFTDIKINNEVPADLTDELTGATSINNLKNIQLEYAQNTITLSFVAIDYSDPKSTRLAFNLKNQDDNWIILDKGKTGFAHYPNLPHGQYEFMVRASNSDGIWSKEQALMQINIAPPWHQTWWFRISAGLVLIGLIYIYIRFRIQRIRREETYLRSEAEFRQKEAEYKQLVAETETAVLKLQMNPHFIYNTMNAISYFILERDVTKANEYLSDFAKLMRMILEFSEKEFISIAQEIELLTLYIKTESLRFENKFDYQIKCDEDLDPDETILPTMLLQPFVENAIAHGIRHKKSKGMIIIEFRLNTNGLNCRVIDDGVGRKKATELRKSYQTHSPKALSITERRLKLLSRKTEKQASMQIIDLFDHQDQPIGTEVSIQLPLL